MGAREKLNSMIGWGCLILSTAIGLALQSGGAFWTTLIVSVATCFFSGGIRPQPAPASPQRRPRRRRPASRSARKS